MGFDSYCCLRSVDIPGEWRQRGVRVAGTSYSYREVLSWLYVWFVSTQGRKLVINCREGNGKKKNPADIQPDFLTEISFLNSHLNHPYLFSFFSLFWTKTFLFRLDWMISRLCSRQAIVRDFCILCYASCIFSEVEAISPFFLSILLSFLREIKFLSSPVRDMLILKLWGGERSCHSEYRYLLCASPPSLLGWWNWQWLPCVTSLPSRKELGQPGRRKCANSSEWKSTTPEDKRREQRDVGDEGLCGEWLLTRWPRSVHIDSKRWHGEGFSSNVCSLIETRFKWCHGILVALQ